MLKATFLEGTICLTIEPDGPLLVKAGESGGADPVLPSMEFVRTHHRGGEPQVYLPGSSLKGVIRAQCERICRSFDSEQQQELRLQQRRKLDEVERKDAHDHVLHLKKDVRVPLADNPLGTGERYEGLDDLNYSSGAYINFLKEKQNTDDKTGDNFKKHPDRTAVIYRRTSFVSQMFGHTSLAGRVRFADAYCDDLPEDALETRNGVAIDRIYGSVAVGPFDYETVVKGEFKTRIAFRNLSLAQLGLLGLALRDLAEGRVAVGFGKSRGLGRVKVSFNGMSLYYPTCELDEQGALRLLGRKGEPVASANKFVGIGALCQGEAYSQYNFPHPQDDTASLPENSGLGFVPDELLGVRLVAGDDAQVRELWKACMPAWKRVVWGEDAA
jgi:CRISPR/Cas system CSM-associated protein Csm3 (group 7 of RAMP superfamily)